MTAPVPGRGRRWAGLVLAAAGLLLIMTPAVPAQTSTARSAGLTLEQARQLALEHNENIQASRENLTQADRDLDVATSHLYPQLSAEGSAVRQKDLSPLTTPDEYEVLQVGVDQHVYQMGKVWTGKEIARHYLKETRLTHERRVQEILFQVTAAYYDVLLGRQSIEIAESALTRAEKQLERARAQFDVGMITETYVLRADVQVAQAREQLERARNLYNVARENLALEIGIPALPGPLAEPAEGDFPEQSLETLIDDALTHRLDLQAAEKQTAAAEANIDWERADFFPKISLHGEYSWTTEELLYNMEDENWSASLNLSCPLFTGGRNRAELAGAKSKHRQARYSLQRLKNSIQTEVRSVYLELQTQRKVLIQYKAQVRSAESNYRQVTAQFEQGLATSVDQVDAFTTLNQAQNQLANAHYNYQLNLVKLQLVTGDFAMPATAEPADNAE
ncbi:MAG: TolC family protein [Desulfosudaceae bacterium]